jgi:hypothetical protein
LYYAKCLERYEMGNWLIDNIKSDPVKWVPIGISLFALLISFFGWREAYRGRLINEAVNRPILTVETDGKAIASLLKEGSTEIVKTLVITSEIKNAGKTSAVVNRIHHTIIPVSECADSNKAMWEKDKWGENTEEPFQYLAGKEVVPSINLKATQIFSIPPGCNGQRISLVSQGVVYYTDMVSGIPYVQEFSKYVTVPDPTFTPSPSPSPSVGKSPMK